MKNFAIFVFRDMRFTFFILLTFIASYTFGQTVYKTPSGSRYHSAKCRSVKNVSTALNLSNAVKDGLTPCKICKPPTPSNTNAARLLPATQKEKGIGQTRQCKGITKKGIRCKHMTRIGNGYCHQHQH
ncbi:MAG: hypothetical protein ACK5NK_12630 [Niabella sp.]